MKPTGQQHRHPNPTLLPSSYYGLNSNAKWEERGGDVGLIDSLFLSASSPDLVMKFARGELFTENTVRTVSPDEIRNFHSVQPFVVQEVVESYAAAVSDELPAVFKWNDEIFIYQGTHRLSAALYNYAEAKVMFVDCDNL